MMKPLGYPCALTVIAAILLLSGCATESYSAIRAGASGSADRAESLFQKAAVPPARQPIAVESESYYVDTAVMLVKDDGLPEMFNKNLQLRFEPRSSLRDATTVLTRATNLRFSYAPDVQGDVDKALLLAGYKNETTLKGFLDQITAQPVPALSWQYKDGQVELFRYTTRVFPLNMPNSDIDFTADASNKNQSVAGGGAATATGHSVAVSSKLKFWDSIEKEVQQMLTPGAGKVVVSKATRSVTVTDTPQALNAVATYIQHLNDVALRKVYLNIQVVTVRNAASDNYGINWSAVYGVLASKYGVTLNSPSLPASFAQGAGAISAVLGAGTGKFETSTALLSVLSSMGKTAKVSTYPQWTMSGVPTHTTVNRSRSYAASVTVVQPTVIGGAPTQTILPATVNYGISLHSVPNVLDADTIQLEESIQISTLDALALFGQAETGQVQLPETSSTSFFPVTTLKHGQTLLMAGLEELDSTIDQAGMGSAENDAVVGTTGSRVGKSTRSTVVVLITPYLM